MTFLPNIVKLSNTLLYKKLCIVCSKNCLNAELCFGSKIEVPSPPKRPLTAYMIFCKENRPIVLKDDPSLSSPDQIKVLAKKWSCLTGDMKKPYEISARESTLLYGEAHKKFFENLTEEQKEELAKLKADKTKSRRILKLKKALRDSGVPKPACSAYSLFVQSEAKNMPSGKILSEFIKRVAETWKSLPQDSKKVYENHAQENKARFLQEMMEWRAKMVREGKEDLIKALDEVKARGKCMDAKDVTKNKN